MKQVSKDEIQAVFTSESQVLVIYNNGLCDLAFKNLEPTTIEQTPKKSKPVRKKFGKGLLKANRSWSLQDETMLLEMRDKDNLSFKEIGKELGRTHHACSIRYSKLTKNNRY